VSTEPRHRHLASGDESALRVVWLYPDLLSTYGDRGNMLILARRAYARGIPVETIEVRSDQAVPEHGDIYLLGGGEDGPQALAANRLNADQGLHRALGPRRDRVRRLRRLPARRHLVLRQGREVRRAGPARSQLRPRDRRAPWASSPVRPRRHWSSPRSPGSRITAGAPTSVPA
jgi:hypothetical protein